jgi:hypothetical protein
MKLRLIFWIVLSACLCGLLFWRNTKIYPLRSVIWRATKSASEIAVLVLTALRLPVVLITWCCIWLTRPIRTPWIKATVGAVVGVILSATALYSMELLLILGVLSIDDITGEREGFLKNFRRAKQGAAEHRAWPINRHHLDS